MERRLLMLILLVPVIIIASVSVLAVSTVFSQSTEQAAQTVDQSSGITDRSFIALGACIAIGLASLGAGISIAATGTAAISASTEKPENFFRSFLVVALAEALAIYGLIIGILLWIKL